MTPERIKQITERVEALPEGPWELGWDGQQFYLRDADGDEIMELTFAIPTWGERYEQAKAECDTSVPEFLFHARHDVPDLQAALAAMQARVQRLEAALADAGLREVALRNELMTPVGNVEEAECLEGCETGNCMDPETHSGYFCYFRECAGVVRSGTDVRHHQDCPVLASSRAVIGQASAEAADDVPHTKAAPAFSVKAWRGEVRKGEPYIHPSEMAAEGPRIHDNGCILGDGHPLDCQTEQDFAVRDDMKPRNGAEEAADGPGVLAAYREACGGGLEVAGFTENFDPTKHGSLQGYPHEYVKEA